MTCREVWTSRQRKSTMQCTHLAAGSTVVGKQFCQRENSKPWLAIAAAATHAVSYFKQHTSCRTSQPHLMVMPNRLTGYRDFPIAGHFPVDCRAYRAHRCRCAAIARAQERCSAWACLNPWKQKNNLNAQSWRLHGTEHLHRTAARFTSVLLASVVSLHICGAADARVATEKLLQQDSPTQSSFTAGFDPAAAAAARGVAIPGNSSNSSSSSSSSRSSTQQQSSVASAAANALQQLTAAQDAIKAGDYEAALAKYTQVVQQHPDLALAEYARLGRAIMLYEMGDVNKSIVGLQDQEISMRGYPEVHAALAAVLYAERPTQRLRAEQQFNIAVEFDSHFQDLQWVATNKHWGPRLQGALQRFLLLQ